MNIKSQ
jgi:chromosome segregation ATPase